MIKDFLVPALVVVVAIAFLDPFMYLMSSMTVNLLLSLLMLASVIYAIFIFKERALDERQVVIRATADRLAYMAGTIVLSGAIIYQVIYMHHVSEEVVLALVVMVVIKSVVHYRSTLKDLS